MIQAPAVFSDRSADRLLNRLGFLQWDSFTMDVDHSTYGQGRPRTRWEEIWRQAHPSKYR